MTKVIEKLRALAAQDEPTCRDLAAVAVELDPDRPNLADAVRRGRFSPEGFARLADELEASW